MPSRTAYNHAVTASSLHTATDVYHERAVVAYGEAVKPILAEDETPADVGKLLSQMGRVIAWRSHEAEAADRAHIDEKNFDIRVYLEQLEAFDQTRRDMVDIGGYCRSVFGNELSAEIIVTEEGLSMVPTMLHKQASHTLARLSNLEQPLPPKKRVDVDFDRKGFVKRLAPSVERLGDANEAVEVERRKADLTLEDKHEAFAAHLAVYRPGVKTFEGLLAFIGQPGLADRLRPPAPRTRKRKGAAGAESAAAKPAVDGPATDGEATESGEAAETGEVAEDRRS